MRTISVFNNISLDGYFTDENNDMSWAHQGADKEWQEFTESNAKGGGVLLFGRITYDLMAGFWPTKMAAEQMPVVAERMNSMQKYVVSKSMNKADWSNTSLINGDLINEIKKLKEEKGDNIVIMGSGSIIAQLSQEKLIDSYQMVVHPIVLGSGRTMFEAIDRFDLKLKDSRVFKNGNVVLTYVLN